ncbi:MAG: hypothetical protein WDN49_14405 [Acetobacteraceae bacterium]
MATTFYAKPVVDDKYAAGRRFRAAGVLAPGKVKTRPAVGGILIEEGLWRFNSGAYHAQWNNLGIPVLDEAGNSWVAGRH